MATVISTETSMTGYVPRGKMSLAEFRQFPEDDSVDRILLAGQLWEQPRTNKARIHAGIEARIAQLLSNWSDQQTSQGLRVFSGEVGCEFPELETSFGIDVAVFSTAVLSQQTEDFPYIVGRPELAVEIISPSDVTVTIHGKIDQYLAAGVPLVWLVNPYMNGVTIFQPQRKPELCSGEDLLTGKNVLPGFQVPVSQLFS